jgi:signal transduction histidine kinase/DNA-binding response OmpR family regulator/CHASE3 domain sensor protein
MKNAFKRNLLIGFGLSILLLIVSSVASYMSITKLLDSSKWVNHTNDVIKQLDGSLSILKDAEAGQRGFLLTRDERFLQYYNGAYERSVAAVDEVKKLTSDNPPQQVAAAQLKEVIVKRLAVLDQLIQAKRRGEDAGITDLEKGKQYMDSARQLVQEMQDRENALLQVRTDKLQRFAASTPLLILVTSILSIIVTLVFFFRISNDFDKRKKLQEALQEKDEETSRRIRIIEGIATKIAAGDYAIRAEDGGADGLGSLAYSLNKMAAALEISFRQLSDKEWLQSGIARLNEELLGEKNLETITHDAINFLASYTGSQVGAFYLSASDKHLVLGSGYALGDEAKKELASGEGLPGQAIASGKPITLDNVADTDLLISFATGKVKPRAIIAVPVLHEGKPRGVFELASMQGFEDNKRDFLTSAAEIIGVVINSAQSRQRVQELFEETQAQSEELQAQHNELENINAELEAQTEKLQASEEELKVQQEELLQANQELEERSRLLEERNQVIVERNLEIQKKAEELSISTKYKSEFLANMSHELRTPLNSILLLSRLLSENNDKNMSGDQVEYAQVIQSSGQGLLSLIDEILDLSKIEAGKMELEYSTILLKEVVQDMNSLFVPVAKERGLQLVMDVEEGLPSQIETDKMRLEQVLKNLLSNALKFTAAGEVRMTIASVPDNPSFISFSVKDTGIGIPAEKQLLIFEAFQQADGSTRRKYGGTGLGLSISRELTRLLGGEIKLTSEAGKGSEFIIYIPKNKAAAGESTRFGPAPREAGEAVAKPVAARARFQSDTIPESLPDDRSAITVGDQVILIIEDDTAFAKALVEFTHKKGYKALVAVRGDEGISLAQQYLPVGILLDIQLPVKDGWEVMEELKSNPATRHIPVHTMSSLEAKKESLMKGAVDFINKPVAFEQMQEVFRRIERVINKDNKKVLILEENPKHAKALAYFLETFNVSAQISDSVNQGVDALQREDVDCVILDMGIPDAHAYEALEAIKRKPGMEQLPIIIFTGKSLSKTEESRIRQYADSIVVKTAHSYQRILDEVSLFLHLVEENRIPEKQQAKYKRLGALNEVLAGKKILIADDDVRNIFSLTKSLEIHNMQVFSAVDGKEALQQLKEHPDMDLVLMDIMMPEMDGYEAMQQVRKNFQFRNLPIIAVTAKAMTGDREKCIRAGASDYISKPVDIDQLLSLLRVWLYDKSI